AGCSTARPRSRQWMAYRLRCRGWCRSAATGTAASSSTWRAPAAGCGGGAAHRRICVALESSGGGICVAGALDRARSVVAAAAVELVTNRWSDDMRVTLVGFGSALGPISEDRLRCVDSLDEVVEGVTDRLAAGREGRSARGERPGAPPA